MNKFLVALYVLSTGCAEILKQGRMLKLSRRMDQTIPEAQVSSMIMKPASDFDILRAALSPRGQAFFFYTAPDLAQLKTIRNRHPEVLEGQGFKVKKTFDAKLNATRAYGVQAS